MTNNLIATRFSTTPLAMVDDETDRVMVYSAELHETLVHVKGRWRIGAFAKSDLKDNFKKVSSAEAWKYLKLAMREVGFL
ncbi:hypothetical protein [Desulfovibrio ferrophilus]|uniref:Tyrosine-protein kinase ptk n=1 Tax=Desulfovibrio ferrophilus TaxID=241368 RepID=A0A2Z6AYT3_9BACT|nr:hypothetical protein [Desulfovibrio ferrophilus]BBD08412.1 tyrosine-protein kinase ptk [Desulfovibrio ferrophilus]